MSVKVLIVDDEKLERVLISNSVEWEKNGFEVIGEAGNGEEALEFFDMNQPDLILTDINMPFMDGVTFAQHIRERSKNCHIIMLTGYREFEYARKAVQMEPGNAEYRQLVSRLENNGRWYADRGTQYGFGTDGRSNCLSDLCCCMCASSMCGGGFMPCFFCI